MHPHARLRPRLHSHRKTVATSLLALFALSALPALATVTTGSMTIPRMMHRAEALPDGRILITGGYARPGTAPYASAEIYDSATGQFTAATPMLQARTEHASVKLVDGRILVAGGSIATSPSLVATNSAEIYDPASGQWSATGNMSVARGRALARLLPDGKVLIMNADSYSGVPYAEIYDPQTGTFSRTGNMVQVTGWHGLVVLADGRVMKVGGYASNYSNRAEIWNPATNQWTATGSMSEARQDIRPVLLPDGKVLVAGGRNSAFLKTSEIYDPASGLFSPGSAIPVQPSSAIATSAATLANGNIIFTDNYSKNLLQYQPTTGQWNLTGPKRGGARETTVSLLPNGNLLLAGGAAQNDATTYAAVWDQACAPQQIALAGTTQSIGANGGQASVTVSAAPGCRFEVTDLPAWVSVDTANPVVMPAAGSMTINFSAAANTTGTDRTASFVVGNNAASITQPTVPLCPTVPTISPAAFNFGAGASSQTIQIAAASSCPWNFSALPTWITSTSSTSGTGNGNFAYTVASNPGVARSASAQLTGPGYAKTLIMNQDANPCASWTISPGSATIPAGGATGSFVVAAPSACNWSLSAVPSWMSVTPSASGTGNGTINYSVAANSGAARSATAVLSGSGPSLPVGLSQAGAATAACSTPITSGTPIAGNLKSSGCPAGARGSSYYTDRYTFTSTPGTPVTILLTSTAFDTYLYLRNPAGTVIKSDDDGGGNLNSRIPAVSGSYTLPAGTGGTYTIEVTSYGAYKTGAYTVNFTQ